MFNSSDYRCFTKFFEFLSKKIRNFKVKYSEVWKMGKNIKLVIVIPAFNEEEMLNITIEKISGVVQGLIDANKIAYDSKILLVNDGSTDNTWQIIKDTSKINEKVTGISFSRNYGHQNALLAGIQTASDADAIISVDADLQDDINVIPDMVDAYLDGNEVVYGVRNNRDTDSFFKRTSAMMFYKLMNLFGANTVQNHADYRLLGRKAINALLQYKERNLFLRGIVPQVGFKSTKVYYKRAERVAGESKYPLKKMIKFAMDGITSFSTVPLRLILWTGFMSVLIAIALGIITIVQHINGATLRGWSSIMLSIWFIGGVQLISIGIIGEYLGKVFIESKHRPLFQIDENLYND